MRQRVSAKRWLATGKASDYIGTIDKLRKGQAVVLYCRVSRCVQRRRGNLADQEQTLREIVERLGGHVVAVVSFVGSGQDSSMLARAAALAKQHAAVIVAETTDRLIRHPAYHSDENWKVQARDIDLQDVKYWADSVPVLTALHPDATPEEARSSQTMRGQRVKGRKGGRPKLSKPGYKKTRRQRLLPIVQSMRREGASLGQIAVTVGVPRSTVQEWV